jgi:hypothetical protein
MFSINENFSTKPLASYLSKHLSTSHLLACRWDVIAIKLEKIDAILESDISTFDNPARCYYWALAHAMNQHNTK